VKLLSRARQSRLMPDGAALAARRPEPESPLDDTQGKMRQEPIRGRSGIEIGAVSFGFDGRVPVLNNVSFSVAPGEFVSVLGPSGCGKSTLVSLAAGLRKPGTGSVTIGGETVTDVRRDVGVMFQGDVLLPWKNVLENVRLGLTFRRVPHKDARQRAEEWIERVGLAGFERHYPSQLSGGMRKRAQLAATMIISPSVLLMDEPFGSLDAQTRNIMQDDLLSIWSVDRPSVLFVTHDIGEALALSDRVVVMTAGPGRVKLDFQVPLARPRDVEEVRSTAEFAYLHEQVWHALKDEVKFANSRRRA
jgi:NitT/TauT family transport system ATP-binding protein